jgi:hypothetical protein
MATKQSHGEKTYKLVNFILFKKCMDDRKMISRRKSVDLFFVDRFPVSSSTVRSAGAVHVLVLYQQRPPLETDDLFFALALREMAHTVSFLKANI